MTAKTLHSVDFIDLVLLLQLASTWAMVGLIWFVQLVHYPLFCLIGERDFSSYHLQHSRRTSWVVGPPMLVELLTAAALLFWRPTGIPAPAALTGFVLVAFLWASTALIQVPLHNRLARTPARADMKKLVLTNWMRTAAWSLRGLLIIWMAWYGR